MVSPKTSQLEAWKKRAGRFSRRLASSMRSVALQGFLRIFKADTRAALSGEVVNLVRSHGANQALEPRVVEYVQDVEKKPDIVDLGIRKVLSEVAIGEGPARPGRAVNGVALLEQEVAEIGAVLARDASDKGGRHVGGRKR
jgi:hypothetical protein